ncbi:MAG TPA: hypothetical protein VMW10_06370 [Alphaproteobacteria bacterium]|nr:hypothetical protein [Alphaproteobacteria bacterium]
MKHLIFTAFLTGALLSGFSQANANPTQTIHFYGLHHVHRAAIAHMTAGVPIPPSAVDHASLMIKRPEAYAPDLSGGPRRLGCSFGGC